MKEQTKEFGNKRREEKRKPLILLATLGLTSEPLSSRPSVVETGVPVATVEREAQPEKKGRATNFAKALIFSRRER